MISAPLGWLGIMRLGLVQMSLGAIVVLTTSTLNRVMVVELALPAMLPGALVAWHYAVQILRPRMGFGSDVGGRHTPWIIGGMGILAVGGIAAAMATALLASNVFLGTIAAVIAFTLVGIGVSAAGTSALVLLAKRVVENRRAAAATILWMMMIFGLALTATLAGKLLDPYSPIRLIAVTSGVSVIAFLVTLAAIWKVEGYPARTVPLTTVAATLVVEKPTFRLALSQVWSEPAARHFTIFIFVSMLAYSAQDLILEPFAGTVFNFTPGESTKLSGTQHGGVLLGMILVAIAGSAFWGKQWGSLKHWMVGGCIASGIALAGIAAAGLVGSSWPLSVNVFLLGFANGAFSIAAIGSMMSMASAGNASREGVRMGLWGAAQAIAFGLGGFLGTALSDLARHFVTSPGASYSLVFAAEALLFLVAAVIASRLQNQVATGSQYDSSFSVGNYRSIA